MNMIMKTHPKGTGLAELSDAPSLFYHDKELGVTSDPHKMLSWMGVTSGTERNYILSFKQLYPLSMCVTFLRLSWVIYCPS